MIKLLIIFNALFVQPDSVLHLKAIDTIHRQADFITTDQLGNLYLINGSTVNKYNVKGDSVFSQNFNTIRNIEFFDASQAMKIYALNYSFNTLIILDNTLSAQNNPISFDRIPVDQVSLLCASNFNNNMWVYDAVNMQLVKLDQNFKVTNASVNFYSHADLSGVPNYMMENENKLYINIPENGIKVFNQYCNFEKNIPVKPEKKFIVRNQKIYYLEEGKIKFYSTYEFTFGEIETKVSGIEDFSIEKNRLYIKKGKEIFVLSAEQDF